MNNVIGYIKTTPRNLLVNKIDMYHNMDISVKIQLHKMFEKCSQTITTKDMGEEFSALHPEKTA